MTKTISQREARAMRAELKAIRERDERRNDRWAKDYPGGVHIGSACVENSIFSAIRTARMLDHAVICVADGNNVRFYGIKP